MTSPTKIAVKAGAHMGVCPVHVENVWQDTWGHLAPKAREIYHGFTIFTLGVHGDITIIDWEYETPEGLVLDGSPWFHDDHTDKVCEWIEAKNNLRGGIWRFDGTFERLKNGNARWRGKVSAMRLAYRFPSKRKANV